MLFKTHWLVRYKLYHIPFWLAYHLLWIAIYIGNFQDVFAYFQSSGSIKFYFYVVFQVIGVYCNLYLLIPKLLYPRAYRTYLGALLALILICTGCITSGYYLTAYVSDKSFFEIFGKQPEQFWNVFLTSALPSTLASMTLGMSIKLGKNWLEADKKQLTLQKENLETELKYLKSQINPHFLFNTINSIFALIHKNPDLASESLASFSDMLRYQLYECNGPETALSKEFSFIENFIELERLRLDEKQSELKFEIKNTVRAEKRIAPFILIPFIENAFKHVSKGKGQKNYIKMLISVDEKELSLKIENSVAEGMANAKTEAESSGIGLYNVKRRLDLLYPEKHKLLLDKEANCFGVNLKIAW